MTKPISNLPASVHQRLSNVARLSQRPYDEVLQYFAMERMLYRLSKSQFADRFTLKGALMLMVWGLERARPTMDIDLLGKTDNDVKSLVDIVREVCVIDVEPDGILFNKQSVRGEPIQIAATYEGVRVYVKGFLGRSQLSLHIDIGFGDVIVPESVQSIVPTILDFPAPVLKTYSRESAIAEKLHAMVKHGQLNSRIKDLYDIWLLSRHFSFDGRFLPMRSKRPLNID